MLQGVDHYFGGLICNFDRPGPTLDAQLTAAVALSTIFMDACALHEQMAQVLLEQSVAKSAAAKLSRK